MVITWVVSIAAFVNGVQPPVGITSSGISLPSSLVIAVRQKSLEVFMVKQKKWDAIQMLAQTKVHNIADIISQATQDEEIVSIEYTGCNCHLKDESPPI